MTRWARRPVKSRKVMALFAKGDERGDYHRIERGGFAVIAQQGRYNEAGITISTATSDGLPRCHYTARLTGNRYVVINEYGPGADAMPPFIGRQFNTPAQMLELMSEILASYIMLHT